MVLLHVVDHVEAVDDHRRRMSAKTDAAEPERAFLVPGEVAEPRIAVVEPRRAPDGDVRQAQSGLMRQNRSVLAWPVGAHAAHVLEEGIDAAERPLVKQGCQLQLRIVQLHEAEWIPSGELGKAPGVVLPGYHKPAGFRPYDASV